MSEPGCPIVRICPNPKWFKNPDNPNPNVQTRTRPGLNSDMTDCPNFKFGHKFGDRTRFFPGRTNSGNRVGQIFASPSIYACDQDVLGIDFYSGYFFLYSNFYFYSDDSKMY